MRLRNFDLFSQLAGSIESCSSDSAGLQRKLNSDLLTSVELVQACLLRIYKHDQKGAKLNAMISIVPNHVPMERSAQLDRERTAGRIKSPFHGIPILVKTPIATGPSLELATTLGSLTLKHSVAPKTAPSLIGADGNSNGWSATGGQTQSAYMARKPDEPSLGQGTESIGFIVMPATRAGLYVFEPALNAVSMDGVFKSSVELDVVGGLARSTADLALLSYQQFLTKTFDSLRIGFFGPTTWSLHPDIIQLDELILKQMNEIYFAAVERIKQHAPEVSVVYPVDIPPATDLWYEGKNPISVVMAYEGKAALEARLDEAKVPGLKRPGKDHADQNQQHEAVKERMKTISKDNGIYKLFREQNLNILPFPMDSLMVFISAASGYPIATMPAGVIQADGRPYGLGIMAQAGSENLTFQFMSAFEAHSPPCALPSRVQDDGSKNEL
ncbi:amidase signature enzyme [Coniochaeta ligniaria NRRL 30616]|uniref:Amidase signature enzyme n=1 Tax=Coniochaeta ligniaria NRRL 30616 TaxID=1408157 RepID=A0A1J7IWK2_9PEZI|nr:amidase signature enzyme [Coniochaeta ligniaria NRRL 30616]